MEDDRRLIVASNFLEDHGVYPFVSDWSLGNPTRAHDLAVLIHKQTGFALSGVNICPGHLECNDFASLTAERREAIEAFWTAYFATGGASVEIGFDSTSILADPERDCFFERR